MHFLTQSPLLKALGWALFDSLWQMALLWLLYSVLIWVFSQIAAGIRHGLALMLVSLGAFWSGATFISAWCWPQRDHWITGSWLNLLPATQYGRLWQVGRFFTDVILVDGSSLYLLVLGGLLIRYLYHYRQSRQLTRHGLSKLPSELRVFVSATSNRMGIRSTVSAWLSSKVDVPLTLGHLKPVILLPVAMVNHLTPQQVEAILVHELAHIRRHDYLLHLAVTALEGFFFFNPFARLLIRQVKKERENCCDDLVLQFRYDRHSYVSALLSLATRSQKIQRAIAATGDGNRLLLERAKRILQQNPSHDRPGVRPLLLLLFAGLITLIVVYGPAHPMTGRQALPAAIAVTTHPGRTSVPTAPMAVRPALLITLSIRTVTTAMNSPRIKGMTTHGHRQQATVNDNAIGPDAGDGQPEDNNVAFINTADDLATSDDATTPDGPAIPDDAASTSSSTAPADPSDPADQSQQNGASREYSIRLTRPNAAPGRIIQLHGTPFVPNTSFSYQLTTADSIHPAEQLIYLQQSTRRDILTALNNLHRQFEEQMKALGDQQIKASESLQLRRQLQSRQVQLQQLYLKKMVEFEKRLEKAGHLRMIVDI
jgi:beta-lactamase regulating signal transducer with metallopeptidase domain